MAFLNRIATRGPICAFFQLRSLANCTTMKKGLVLGLYENHDSINENMTPDAKTYNDRVNGKLVQYLEKAGPKLKKGETRLFWGLDDPEYTAVVVVGVGKKDAKYNEEEEIYENRENVREAAAAGCRTLMSNDIRDIAVDNFGDPEATAEGTGLQCWWFQEFKNKEKQKEMPKVSLFDKLAEEKWEIGRIKANAQNWSRKLAETPANRMTPTIFSEEVRKVLTPLGVEVKVYDREWAQKKGMNSFLSVSQGSAEPPKFLEMSYKGAESNKSNEAPIVLVGKGVTFDAGGISLKPSADMDLMRYDMGGAACVVSAIRAAAELKLKTNIIGLTPLTENLPSGTATKPGDIVFAMNGKSIIVDNTDAEGRLILADALCYANEFKPRFVVDLATLTGAIKIALDAAAVGVFTNNTRLYQAMQEAGSVSGDRVWRMPLWKYYTDKLKPCKYADLNNMGKSRNGGSCVAAAFLREFAPPNTPWMHMDIAATMGAVGHDEDGRYISNGMSGIPTRTLIQFLQDVQSKNI